MVEDPTKKILDSKINWTKYPAIKKFKVNREKSYFVLYFTEKELGVKALSAGDISKILTKKFRTPTSSQAVRAALNPKIGEEIEVTQNSNGTLLYHLLPNALPSIGLNSDNINMEFRVGDMLIPFEIFDSQRGYIKKILLEINGCYRDAYFNACSTMIRRLFETLIIEIYEKKGMENKIKNDGKYLMLDGLMKRIINEDKISISSQTKKQLGKIKLFGDTGAHSRKIILRKHDLDKYRDEIRLCAEDLVSELN